MVNYRKDGLALTCDCGRSAPVSAEGLAGIGRRVPSNAYGMWCKSCPGCEASRGIEVRASPGGADDESWSWGWVLDDGASVGRDEGEVEAEKLGAISLQWERWKRGRSHAA